MSKHITQREMRQILYGDVPTGATAFDELRAMVSDSDEPPSDDPVRLGILMARAEQEPAPAPARQTALYALTIKQPWAWAILHAGKRIENREWAPPRAMIGKHLAIHTAKTFDEDGYRWLFKRNLISVPFPPEVRTLGAVVGVAVLDSVVTESDNQWFQGHFGWVLRDVVVLPMPVPCRGALKLWTLPEDVQIEVLSQIDAEALKRHD